MSDIVERLRDGIGIADNIPDCEAAMDAAADEIERLRAALTKSLEVGSEASISTDRWLVLIEQQERLLAALREIASHDTGMRPDFSAGAKQAAIARRALEGKPTPPAEPPDATSAE